MAPGACAVDRCRLVCDSAEALEAFGAALAAGAAGRPLAVYLRGELGAGKSTLARGFIRQRGVHGAVKSPTFTVVEPYQTAPHPIYHFDLYRMASADELYAIGIEDYFDGHATCLVEWPERGDGCLPEPDVDIGIAFHGAGRRLSATAHGAAGRAAMGAAAAAAATIPGLVLSSGM